MEMPAIRASIAAVAVALLALGSVGPEAFGQGTKGPNVLIRLRLAGDAATLPRARSCLADKLSQMPDVKVATAPTEGVRFVVDTVVKSTDDAIFASLASAITPCFGRTSCSELGPMRTCVTKEGQDADALLNSQIAPEIGDKVLSKEYIESND